MSSACTRVTCRAICLAVVSIALLASAKTLAATPEASSSPSVMAPVFKYGPNIIMRGSPRQVRRIRHWLDVIFSVPKGRETLNAITRTPHTLVIEHSRFAVISAGRTRADMTMRLSDGRGDDVDILFNTDIPERGSHVVFDSAHKPLEYPAVHNLFHELAHARHKMTGTWQYFRSEAQAVVDENVFRADFAARQSVSYRPRAGKGGAPVCAAQAGERTPAWGRELVCDR